MHNLGLAFYKLKEYEKCVNCLSEASELYSNKFSMWFWMGSACIKNYVNQGGGYFMKNSSKTILLRRQQLQEVDAKIPEKMKLNQAIRYLENVIISYDNFTKNESEVTETIKKINLSKMFSNIPHSQKGKSKKKESKVEERKSELKDEFPYKMGLHSKSVTERFNYMTKSAYLLLIYSYLLLNNSVKALEYCKILKSDFKLNSKMNFDLKMYLAEIYLIKGKHQQAFKCLKIDQAFEEGKGKPESADNYIDIENTNSGYVEKNLPKRAIMFLNIATCNYLLEIPEEAGNAISNALECLGLTQNESNQSRKLSISEVPEFLLHSLVYLNLYNGDEETALKLLRKRRFEKNNEDLLNFSLSLAPLKIFR